MRKPVFASLIIVLNVALIAVTLTIPDHAIARAGEAIAQPFTLTLPQPQAIYRVTLRSPTDAAFLVANYDVLEAREGDDLFILGDEAAANTLRAQGFSVTLHSALPILHSHQSTTDPSSSSYVSGFRQSWPILSAICASSSSMPKPGPVGTST